MKVEFVKKENRSHRWKHVNEDILDPGDVIILENDHPKKYYIVLNPHTDSGADVLSFEHTTSGFVMSKRYIEATTSVKVVRYVTAMRIEFSEEEDK